MKNSKVEEYLKVLAEGNKDTIPVPSSRVDYYLNYLIKGGVLEELPQPEARMDTYLYALCEKGIGSSGNKESHISRLIVNQLEGVELGKTKALKSIEVTQIVLKKG
ncbi:MAG: hypothetical protein AB9856_03055 [Cellulosilyticaceae bacterium]